MTNCTSSFDSARSRPPVSLPLLPPDILRGISAHANDLYHAIYNGYRCKCPFPHQACLGLHQVSPGHINVSEPFELFFSVDESSVDESSVDESTTTQISELGQKWSNSPREPRDHSLLFRLVSFSKSKDDFKDGRLIDDLCTFTKNFGDDSPVPAPAPSLNILASKEKKYIMKMSSLSIASQSFVCLDDYLIPYEKWELTKQKRMALALSLSTAILLFYSTPWIDSWWTLKDFYILKDDISRIFITRTFYGAHGASLKPLPQSTSRSDAKSLLWDTSRSKSKSLFWDCFGEPILTRLGFALIELALGKRLSELRAADVDPNADQDMIDTITAMNILADGSVLIEAGQVYHNAVLACLSHQARIDSGSRSLDSKHPNFQQDLVRFVVGPMLYSYLGTDI